MSTLDLSALPLFPLDNVVLFPHVQVPLFIFEPRYRQMTAAALEGDGLIGMAVVMPRHRDEMPADPPIFPIGCAGRIAHAESHPDGTYHIVLQGVARFRIDEEHLRSGDRLYRSARVSLLEDDPGSPESIAPLRDRVLELMRIIAPDRAEELRASRLAPLDDGTFIDAFCQSLDFGTLEKQQLLEANGVRARGERLVSLMEFRIAEQSSTGRPGSGTVH